MSKELEIQIIGEVGTGKSSVAHEIASALEWVGIAVDVRDEEFADEWYHRQDDRMRALSKAGLRVRIRVIQKNRIEDK